jgi:transposase-like protein
VQLHRNAKTCPKGRALLVTRVTELGWTMQAAATASGISRRTGFKWLARYRAEGHAGFFDRSSAPRSCPHRTRRGLEGWIVALRARRPSGPAIAHRTGVPPATVGHVLRRHGLGRLPALTPRPPIHRYEWAQPGRWCMSTSRRWAGSRYPATA